MKIQAVNNYNYVPNVKNNSENHKREDLSFQAGVNVAGEVMKSHGSQKFNDVIKFLRNMLKHESGPSLNISKNRGPAKEIVTRVNNRDGQNLSVNSYEYNKLMGLIEVGTEDLELSVGRKKSGFCYNNNEEAETIAADMFNTYQYLK